MKKLMVNIGWGTEISNIEMQTKSFADEQKAVEFCRKHYKNIWFINERRTLGMQMSHFEIIEALKTERVDKIHIRNPQHIR